MIDFTDVLKNLIFMEICVNVRSQACDLVINWVNDILFSVDELQVWKNEVEF